METSQDNLFEQAMARYQSGAAADEVLPDFARIVEAAPRQSAGWTCLAWLQLLWRRAVDVTITIFFLRLYARSRGHGQKPRGKRENRENRGKRGNLLARLGRT